MLLTQPDVRRGHAQIGRLPLHWGGELREVSVAYTLEGDRSGPLVIALGGISAGRNVTEWWTDFAGVDKAIDTGRCAVLGIDFIAASDAQFPSISTFDQARAIAAVLDELNVATAYAFVGSSYGGMVALAFGALFPERVQQLLVIAAAHEPHPMATALRSLQRRTIRLGIETGRVAEAVSIARGIAMTTYRTAAEFSERFDVVPERNGSEFRLPVESYLLHQGAVYARSKTPWGFLCLSESIDLHHVDPARIRVPTTLVAVDSDTLVPVWQLRALAAALGGRARLICIESLYGHDAFLKEVAAVSEILRSTLNLENLA